MGLSMAALAGVVPLKACQAAACSMICLRTLCGYDIEEGIKFAKQVEGYIDLLRVSAGSHEVDEAFTVTHPSMFLPDRCNAEFAEEAHERYKHGVFSRKEYLSCGPHQILGTHFLLGTFLSA